MSTAESQESKTPHPETPADAMTYRQFMDWADEDTLAEWVNGRAIMTSPASLPHQDLVDFIHDLLARFAALHDLGRAIQAPFVQHLPNVPSAREPDVIFVARDHLNRLQPPAHPTSLEGPADLVVEVVSPESTTRDYEDKFGEYARGGVPEYWIIDPTTREAHFHRLDVQGAYQVIAPDAQGIYRTPNLPGFWLRAEWLWQSPLPDVDAAVQQIDEDAYLDRLTARLDEAAARRLLERLRRQGKLPENTEE